MPAISAVAAKVGSASSTSQPASLSVCDLPVDLLDRRAVEARLGQHARGPALDLAECSLPVNSSRIFADAALTALWPDT